MALVVSREYTVTDSRVTEVAQLLAYLCAKGQCHRREFRPALETAGVSVAELRGLVGAVERAVDHVVRVGREARYRRVCDPIR